MKKLYKKIISVFLVITVILSLLSSVSYSKVSDYPLFSINIVSETDSKAVISINLESGSFEYVTFYLLPDNNISACSEIKKSEKFAGEILKCENNGEAVIVATNPNDYMVTIASMHKFTEIGSYFEFTIDKISADKLTQKDLTVSISDIGATFINKLPFGFGDVNFDNKITTADASQILKHCNGSLTLNDDQKYWADVNKDGTVTTLDAYWILKYCEGSTDNFSLSLKPESDNSPVFSINTVFENEESVLLSLKLEKGDFTNGTFSFSANTDKYSDIKVSRSDYFKDLSVEISDNGGYTLFNTNKTTVSIASTQVLRNIEDYIYISLNKISDKELTEDDITVKISDIDATVSKNITHNLCEHTYITEIKDATCTADGTITEKCSQCGKIINTIALPRFIQNCIISGDVITGIAPCTTVEKFIDDNFYSTTATINIENSDSGYISTGTVITTKNYNNVAEKYTVILYGDVNCDGRYDGTDSVVVNCLVNDMLKEENFTEYQLSAADCNHDGIIDEFDVELLNEAGLMFSKIDQTKDEIKLQSVLKEYNSLIIQAPVENETIKEQFSLFEIFINIFLRLSNLIKILTSILY